MKKIVLAQTQEMLDMAKNNLTNLKEGSDIFLVEKPDLKEIIKLVKKQKAFAAIYIEKEGNPRIIYRKDGTWKAERAYRNDLTILKRDKLLPKGYKDLFNEILTNDCVETENLTLYSEGIIFENELKDKYFKERVEHFLSDEWVSKEREVAEKDSYFIKFSHRKLNSIKGAGLFAKALNNKQKIQGIDYRSFSKIDDNKYLIVTSKSRIIIEVKDGKADLYILSKFNNDVTLHYYHNGIVTNISNNLTLNKVQSKKIRKRDIVISVVGSSIFLLLTILTFTLIFKPENTSTAFQILFDKHTLSHVWIYLIWMNFFITFFFSFIVMYTISWMVNGKKPNARSMWTYFVAAQLKATTRFITGEAIIGTIIWGWYITKTNKVRTSSLVGTVATISIIRAIFLFVLAIPFMVSGTVYANQIFNDINIMNGGASTTNQILFYTLSWGGYIWGLIHNTIMSMIVFLYPIHYIYNKIYTGLSLRKDPSRTIDMMENREMSLRSMKGSYSIVIKDKNRIIRTAILVLFPILLNAFEMMYIFKMTEDYMMIQPGGLASLSIAQPAYNNFFQLSGIRYMSNCVHDFPLLTIVPGNGMGFIEYFMAFSNEAVFLHEHGVTSISDQGTINALSSYAEDFAEQTAFITRFFGTYLRRLLSMVVSLWVVFKLVTRKTKSIA